MTVIEALLVFLAATAALFTGFYYDVIITTAMMLFWGEVAVAVVLVLVYFYTHRYDFL